MQMIVKRRSSPCLKICSARISLHGKDVDSCVSDVADMRIEAQGKAEFFDMGVPDILDYEKMKDKLQMRICDKEWNTRCV